MSSRLLSPLFSPPGGISPFVPCRLAVLLFFFLASTAFADTRIDFPMQSLDGHSSTTLQDLIEGRAAVLMFWRSDCEPCLEEMKGLESLRKAAHPAPLLLIGLESPGSLRAMLERMRLDSADAWQTDVDPAAVLKRFGSNPPRLPLSVMLDRRGRICARRMGTLGPALITEWLAACDSKPPRGAAP